MNPGTQFWIGSISTILRSWGITILYLYLVTTLSNITKLCFQYSQHNNLLLALLSPTLVITDFQQQLNSHHNSEPFISLYDSFLTVSGKNKVSTWMVSKVSISHFTVGIVGVFYRAVTIGACLHSRNQPWRIYHTFRIRRVLFLLRKFWVKFRRWELYKKVLSFDPFCLCVSISIIFVAPTGVWRWPNHSTIILIHCCNRRNYCHNNSLPLPCFSAGLFYTYSGTFFLTCHPALSKPSQPQAPPRNFVMLHGIHTTRQGLFLHL